MSSSKNLVKQLQKDGKTLKYGGNNGLDVAGPFLFNLLIVLPIWLVTLVPLAIANVIATKFILKKPKAKAEADQSANYVFEKPSNVTELKKRPYDLIVFGATGFTGKQAVKYLAKQYGTNVKWAIAGRSKDALQKIRDEVAGSNTALKNHIGLLVGDSNKIETLFPIVNATRAIVTTAGPFDKYGSLLVNACALYGTAYGDITGESDWVRKMIDNFDGLAKDSGARIVNFCGHDCVPWDISVQQVAKKMKELGEDLVKVECIDVLSGDISGGTLATIFHSLTSRQTYKSKIGYDPLLKPLNTGDVSEPSNYKLKVINQSGLSFNKKAFDGEGSWVGPFVMAMVMANCVRRSNAINKYSPENKPLVYYESRAQASLWAGILDQFKTYFMGTILFSPLFVRDYIRDKFLVKPGQGPSEAEMDDGFLLLTVIGTGSKGSKVESQMYFNTDPGYRDTARILVESGLALSLNADQISVGGGVYTPGSCQKDVLLKRLNETGSEFQIKVISKA